VRLLDAVTPRWWDPINPKTLKISNRQACYFAQSSHEFKKGIVETAKKALSLRKRVRLLDNQDINGTRWSRKRWPWLPATGPGKPKVLDVFYYGFDVTWKDAGRFFPDFYGGATRGSRKAMFGIIDRLWHDVVVQRKAQEQKPVAPM